MSDHLVAGELHNDFSISLEEFVDGTYNYFVFMKNKNNIVSVHLSHRSVCMPRDMQTIFDRNRTIIDRSKTIIENKRFRVFQPIFFEVESIFAELLNHVIHKILGSCHLDIPKDIHDLRLYTPVLPFQWEATQCMPDLPKVLWYVACMVELDLYEISPIETSKQ